MENPPPYPLFPPENRIYEQPDWHQNTAPVYPGGVTPPPYPLVPPQQPDYPPAEWDYSESGYYQTTLAAGYPSIMPGYPGYAPPLPGVTPEFDTHNWRSTIFPTMKMILFQPDRFFSGLAKDDNIKPAIIFAMITSAAAGLFVFIVGAFIYPFSVLSQIGIFGALSFLAATKIYKGKATIGNTIKGMAYVYGATFPLQLIPFIGGFSYIYIIYLTVIMLKHTHGLSMNQAIIAALLPHIQIVLIGICMAIPLIVIWLVSPA